MTKPVTLSDAAYDALSRVKGKDMSFSDAVLKLVENAKPKRDFRKFAGALKSQAAELEKLRKEIEAGRAGNYERM